MSVLLLGKPQFENCWNIFCILHLCQQRSTDSKLWFFQLSCTDVRTGPQEGWAPNNWCSADTLATWCEKPTHWKRPWCLERLRVGGEGGETGDEMVGWHHRLSGHESEQTLGDSEGQGGLVDAKSWTWLSEQQQQQIRNCQTSKENVTSSFRVCLAWDAKMKIP